MPFMLVRSGGKLYNYTRGADGKPTGKPHGSFPDTPAGRAKQQGQMRVLWASYADEQKSDKLKDRGAKMETSQTVGFGIPDDDMKAASARYYKGAEVYVKSINEQGMVLAVGVYRKSFAYRVQTKSGFIVCRAHDLVFAGKSAMKALKMQQANLIKLCDADTLSMGDIASCVQSLGDQAKTVAPQQRATAVMASRCLKAAWAILRANPKAQDMAKTFVKQAADCFGTPAVEAEQVNDLEDVNAMGEYAKAMQTSVKSLIMHIEKIKAAGVIAPDDEESLLDDTESLRTQTLNGGDPEQMAILAQVEEAIYSPQDAGMQAWSNRVLGMVDEYQKHIAQVA